jgi:hypothetical protein
VPGIVLLPQMKKEIFATDAQRSFCHGCTDYSGIFLMSRMKSKPLIHEGYFATDARIFPGTTAARARNFFIATDAK